MTKTKSVDGQPVEDVVITKCDILGVLEQDKWVRKIGTKETE